MPGDKRCSQRESVYDAIPHSFRMVGWRVYLQAIPLHVYRAFMTGNLGDSVMIASVDERQFLLQRRGVKGNEPVNFLAWRKSCLVSMIFPTAVVLGLQLGDIYWMNQEWGQN